MMGLKTGTPFSAIDDAGALSFAFSEISDALMQQVEAQGVISNFECRLPHAADPLRWIKADVRRIPDADGKTRYYVAYLTDITSLKFKEAELSHLAFFDSLTGLPNRSLFINKVGAALHAAKRYPEQYAVISLDMDALYNINQHYGRDFGDMLLRHTAATLVACCRETDTVGRTGSDEFSVLLRDPEGGPGLIRIIKRIRAKFETPFTVWDKQLGAISAHFGVIFPLSEYNHAESVLRDVGLATSMAKTTGNSLSCKFFSKKMMEKTRKELSLAVVLQKKHDLKGFSVVYQPIMRPADSGLYAFEALARWSHQGKAVSPSIFIPIAEKTGFIKSLGQFVLETACRQLRRWRNEYGTDICMHINVSPHQLVAHDFPDSVRDTLYRTGIEGAQLFFEVTESIFLRDFAKALHNINRLRQQGVRFCLDDFGTGYSSLSYLKLLPLDALKIDRSFVQDLEKDAISRVLLRHIITLGTDLGYTLVVEGVERQTQLALLGDIDRLLIQGFYFYKPLGSYAADALMGEEYGEAISRRE
jgi:diguanylate cyclase (GGDEF)-like protein